MAKKHNTKLNGGALSLSLLANILMSIWLEAKVIQRNKMNVCKSVPENIKKQC